MLHRYVIRNIRSFSEQSNWKIPQSDLFCILSTVSLASSFSVRLADGVVCCSDLFEVSVSFTPPSFFQFAGERQPFRTQTCYS
jgi:hypothetical protein